MELTVTYLTTPLANHRILSKLNGLKPLKHTHKHNMHINITLGDPAGIGPEVTFKALRSIKTHPGIVLFMHPKNEAYIDLHEEFPLHGKH